MPEVGTYTTYMLGTGLAAYTAVATDEAGGLVPPRHSGVPSTHLPPLGKKWPGQPMQSLLVANATERVRPTVGDLLRPVCGRQCERYDSFVVLTHDSQAGLTNRVAIIAGASLMATSLCARLAIPPPAGWLSAQHNNDRLVDPSCSWDRYLEIAHLSDGQSILARRDEVPEYEQSIGPTPWHQVSEEYEQFRGLPDSAPPFVWTINDSYFSWYESLASLESACGVPIASEALLRERPEVWGFPQSYKIEGIAEQVKSSLTTGMAPERLHTLHVRRGDPVGVDNWVNGHCQTIDVSHVVEQSLDCDPGCGGSDLDCDPGKEKTDVLVFFMDQTDQVRLPPIICRWGGERLLTRAFPRVTGVQH